MEIKRAKCHLPQIRRETYGHEAACPSAVLTPPYRTLGYTRWHSDLEKMNQKEVHATPGNGLRAICAGIFQAWGSESLLMNCLTLLKMVCFFLCYGKLQSCNNVKRTRNTQVDRRITATLTTLRCEDLMKTTRENLASPGTQAETFLLRPSITNKSLCCRVLVQNVQSTDSGGGSCIHPKFNSRVGRSRPDGKRPEKCYYSCANCN